MEVQEYDIALALAAAEGGADEIQFDYVRFPAEGDQKDAGFAYQKKHPEWQRSDVIADFLQQGVCLVASEGRAVVAGCVRRDGVAAAGGFVAHGAGHCAHGEVLRCAFADDLSLALFWHGRMPSREMTRSILLASRWTGLRRSPAGSGAVIRPWLQAFAWRTKTYSPKYIEVQVLTAKNKGGVGFLFWNANNDYSKPYAAMPEMKAAKGQYFRGDEDAGGAEGGVGGAAVGHSPPR